MSVPVATRGSQGVGSVPALDVPVRRTARKLPHLRRFGHPCPRPRRTRLESENEQSDLGNLQCRLTCGNIDKFVLVSRDHDRGPASAGREDNSAHVAIPKQV